MSDQPEYYLAIEAGGTHSRGALFDASGACIRDAAGGPCNPTAYGMDRSITELLMLANQLIKLEDHATIRMTVGAAGVVGEEGRQRMANELAGKLRVMDVRVADDLYPVLFANAEDRAAVLAIAGTGSNVLACDTRGNVAQCGGRGHVFGDEGSSYAIAVSALRAAAYAEDGLGEATELADYLAKAADVDTLDDLVTWTGQHYKKDIAGLAHAVVAAATAGDSVAAQCIEREAGHLAQQIHQASSRLRLDGTVTVYGQGGLFEGCPPYVNALVQALEQLGSYDVQPPKVTGAAALLHLAQAESLPEWATESQPGGWTEPEELDEPERFTTEWSGGKSEVFMEAIDPINVVMGMILHDAQATDGIHRCEKPLAEAIEVGARVLRGGGRILYFGAGTSGRLGVLDASECPPTFGVDPDRVVGVMAGGDRALRESIEGAEDDATAGAQAVSDHGVTQQDFVIGIAASGTTPYVMGALDAARACGAKTALLSANPNPKCAVDITIALNTGTELIPGSTRLKAGTATKVALNTISTGAFVHAGYVYRNLMVGMRPTNKKLRARAARIVAEITDASADQAQAWLEQVDYNIVAAILVGRDGLPPEAALEQSRNAPAPADALK